jgi:intracellular septation protein
LWFTLAILTVVMFLKLLLNLTIEFGPIFLFLVISQYTEFFTAVSVFIVATIIVMIVSQLERKSFAWFPLIVGIVIVVSGLLTVFLQDPFYIIFKDTIYNTGFALVLSVGLYYDRPLLKPLFQGLFAMTHKGWKILTMRWIIMFVLLAISNELVRIYMSTEDWVVYKSLATITTMIFSVYQFRLAKKERLPEASPWGMRI